MFILLFILINGILTFYYPFIFPKKEDPFIFPKKEVLSKYTLKFLTILILSNLIFLLRHFLRRRRNIPVSGIQLNHTQRLTGHTVHASLAAAVSVVDRLTLLAFGRQKRDGRTYSGLAQGFFRRGGPSAMFADHTAAGGVVDRFARRIRLLKAADVATPHHRAYVVWLAILRNLATAILVVNWRASVSLFG